MNFPPAWFVYHRKHPVMSIMQPPGVTWADVKEWIPTVGNYGINPLLFLRQYPRGDVNVGYVVGEEVMTAYWEPLLKDDDEPWFVSASEELVPITHAPGKIGALAHVTERGTAFFELRPYNVTHQYTDYMINNPMFYNMQKQPRSKELKGHPIRRINYAGWNALFDFPKDSYKLKLDAEGIAKPLEDWIKVEVDGQEIPLDTEYQISRGVGGEIILTALETLTDIIIRCNLPILLWRNENYPRSVNYIKMLFKGESVILGYEPPDYDVYATSESRHEFFHITITAEVWKTDLDWSCPCCVRVGYCPY
jgi:hypothetical protein